MAFMAGKYARVNANSGGLSGNVGAVAGPFRWTVGFRRERLDTTNFESQLGVTGINVHSEGLTGVLDSIFNMEGYINNALANTFFPDQALNMDFLFAKPGGINASLGYRNIYVDVLNFSPQVAVRDRISFNAELQTSYLVTPAS